MSAIFGIIHKHGQAIDDRIAALISCTLKRRAAGILYAWREQTVFIAQCPRPMPGTLSPETTQIITADIVLVADLRLDNRAYLLQQTGAAAGSSDQQLLLHAYRLWGNDCVHHLEGEYAFGIWHRQHHCLLLATDHIGCRPLYYYDSPDMFIFSSEQKAILAVKPAPHVFNETSLIEYHFHRSDPAATYTKDVYALCGGNRLTLEGRTLRISKYWKPVAGKYHFSKHKDWTDCLRELISRAIRNRIPADRPVGITLSGGLDSSSIACLLAEQLKGMNKPLYAFSSVLPEGGNDERKYIELVGKCCPNIIQTYIHTPEGSPFNDTFPAFEMDESIPNIFYYIDHAILSAASSKDIGVLFTGYGGDHWVSWKGNPVIYNMINNGEWGNAWRLLRSFSSIEKKSLLHILKREYAVHTPWYKMLRKRQSVATTLQQHFYKKHQATLELGPVRNIAAFMSANIVSGRTGIFPAMLANRNAAYGMQSAVPLLDKHVLEFMMDVPQQLFVEGGYKRSLMRHAMEGVLPGEVQWRQDKGMYSPDFIARIAAGQPVIAEILASPDHALAFRHYLSKERIRQPRAKDELTMIRMIQGIVSSIIIAALQKNGYVFEDNFS